MFHPSTCTSAKSAKFTPRNSLSKSHLTSTAKIGTKSFAFETKVLFRWPSLPRKSISTGSTSFLSEEAPRNFEVSHERSFDLRRG